MCSSNCRTASVNCFWLLCFISFHSQLVVFPSAVANKWGLGVIDYDVLFVGNRSSSELFILAVIYDFVLLLSTSFLGSAIQRHLHWSGLSADILQRSVLTALSETPCDRADRLSVIQSEVELPVCPRSLFDWGSAFVLVVKWKDLSVAENRFGLCTDV